MANAVGKVALLEGQAFARGQDGSQRALKVGDVVMEGEVIVTGAGSHVELAFDGGQSLLVREKETVTLDKSVLGIDLPEGHDAALLDRISETAAITRAIAEGSSLDELLEETAAGLDGGSGEDGHNFVQLLRIVEGVPPLANDYGTARGYVPPELVGDGGRPDVLVEEPAPAAPVAPPAPVGNVPVAVADNFSLNEDATLNGTLATNDTASADGGNVWSLAGNASHGVVTVNADGSFSYTPAANYHGPDSFSYTITDTDGSSSTATVTLTVNPTNDVPVAVTDNFTLNEDATLNGTLATNDSPSADGGNTWSLAGNASHGAVTVNADGTFSYTPAANYAGPDSFSYTITDADGSQSTATVTLTVNPTNDVPVAVADNFTLNEDASYTGTLATNDTASADGGNVWSLAGNATHGVVSVNADGSFSYTPAANYNGPDSFSYTITDSDGSSSTATVTLTVNPTNDVPVAVADNFTLNEDASYTGTLATNDSQSADGGNTWSLAGNASHGVVSVNADGSFSYTPAANYNGPDSFSYTITDSDGSSSTGTVTLTVNSQNDVPVAVADNFSLNEDATLNGTLATNDTQSADGGNTWSLAGNATHGVVTVDADGSFSYTPAANYNGPDSFSYTITDSDGSQSTATVTLTVNPTNDVPVAVADNFTLDEDASYTGTLATNDTPSADGGNVWSLAGNASHGVVTVNADGSFSYTPAANYNGPDSFSYTITDTDGSSSTATVTLTVNSQNDVPVAVADNFSLNEDGTLTDTLATNDTQSADGGNTWSLAGNATHGVVTVNADGSFSYTPAANYNGPDSFSYTITDSDGSQSTATVTLTVNPTNDVPVAVADNFTLNEDATLNGTLVTNDTQSADGGNTWSLAGNASHGVVTVNADGSFSYTPAANYNGPDSFSYTITDSDGSQSTATVTLTVNSQNDVPVAVADNFSLNEDATLNGTLATNDTQSADGGNVWSLAGNATHGVVTVNADGSFSYTPAADYNGPDSFSYTLTDTDGSSSTATVTLTVNSQNDVPVAVADNFTLNEDATLNGTLATNDSQSADGGNTWSLAGNASHGVVTVNADGSFSYTPAANYNGPDSFSYTITDTDGSSSTATVTLTVNSQNDVPVAVADNFSLNEDATLNGTLATNDTASPDGGNTWSLAGNASHGVVTVNADGSFSYTPAANSNGPDSFSYTITDSDGSQSTATVTLTVNPTNDVPVAVADNFTVNEDATLNGNLATNDTASPDGGNVWSLAGNASHGVVTVNADGSFSYTPAANYNGPDSFSYTITDSDGSQSTATVTLAVNSQNDVPVAINDNFSLNEDASYTGTLATNDTASPDGGNTWSLAGNASHGVVTVNAHGTFSYTPAANYNGPDSFSYTITDADGSQSTATVTLTVNPINDVPVAVADNFTLNEDASLNGTLATNDTQSADGGNIWSLAGNATHGVVTVNADGSFSYTPAASYNGPDSFSYTITDSDGSSSTGTVTLTVNSQNDVPVAVADNFSLNEDATLNGNLATNDTPSADGGNTWSLAGNATHGVVSVNADGSFSYTPAANYNGPDSFSYTITDADGSSSTATVTLTVNPTNDVPVAINDNFTVNEDATLNSTLATNDSQSADGGNVWSLAGNATHGVVTVNADGSFSYTPAVDYNGPDSFSYTITDTDGSSSTATVTLTVNSQNDVPVAVADNFSLNEDASCTGTLATNDTASPDGGNTWSLAGNATHGVVTVNADGSFSYTPAADYNGPDSFSYTITDADGSSSTATVTLTVNPINDVPVAVADNFTLNEDATLNGNLATNDTASPDGGNTWSLAGNATHGVVTVNADGSFSYTPAADYNGPDSFSYTITDTDGSSSTATVTLTVNSQNDVPVAVADNFTVNEDATLNGTLATNDTQSADGGNTWSLAGNASHGVVTVNADGSFSYTPAADYNGPDSFSYTITDADGSSSTATVTLTVNSQNDVPVAVADNFSLNEDATLNGTLVTNDTASADGGNVWSLAGNASHGVVTVNADGTFSYTPAADYNGPDSFSYTITDADGSSSTATVTLTINPTNDVPVALADNFTLNEDATYTGTLATNDTASADGGNVWSLAGNATHGVVTVNADGSFSYTPAANYNGPDSFSYTITDADGSSSTATVTLTVNSQNDVPVAVADNFSLNEDATLNGTLVTNDTASPDGGNVWSLAGNATHGVVTVNADGTFSYTPAVDYAGPDSFSYSITDADGSQSTATVTLTVNPTNDVPVAVADNFTVNEDATLNGTLATNDTASADGGNTWSLAGNATHGVVSVNADGSFSYTPAADYNGPDSFTYTITDSDGSQSTATVTLTVNPTNDVPVAIADNFTVNEDATLNGTLATNDTQSADGGNTWSLAGNASHGVVTVNADGTFSYTPAADYNGPDSFTYTITDSDGSSSTATVTLTVNPTNDVPVAVTDDFTLNEDATLNGTLVTNDTASADGGNTWSLAGNATHGVVTVNADGSFSYTPAADYNGPDSFSYTITDADGSSSTATVTLTVNSQNDVPVAINDNFTVNEDASYTGTLATNDTASADGGNVWSLAGNATHGVVTVNADGSFAYTPAADYNGPDSFSYTITDADGSQSTATVTLTVNPTNDVPVAVADNFTLNEDATLNGNLATNDTASPDGGNTWSLAGNATHGVVTVNADGSFSYTPAADYNGPDSFNYTITDTDGSQSTATVTLTVNPTNDVPVAVTDNFSLNEDATLNGTLATNDTQSADGGNTWSLAGNASHGVVTVNADGSFAYTPAANYNGPDSFSYTITDSDGSQSTATVTLAVNSQNDVPVAVADNFTLNEDATLTGTLATNDSQSADGGNTWSLAGNATHGVVTVNADGSFAYTPAANYNGPDSFSYTITDSDGSQSTATVTLTVNSQNDVPVAVADNFTVNEDATLNGNLATNDTQSADGGNTWSLAGNATHGVVTVNADGSFSYTPAANYNGPDSFSYTITDTDGSSSTATVTLTVNSQNDVPVAINDGVLAATEDTALTIAPATLLGNDSDVDGNPLTIASVQGAVNGTVALVGGNVVFTPAPGYNGPASFSYTISDGQGGSDTATVTLNVGAVNDVPVATADSYSTDEDTTLSVALPTTVLANDNDLDGDSLTVNTTPVTDVANGSLTLNADGSFTYVPNANFSGSDSFVYSVSDGHGGTAQATVTITVNPVNDAPVVSGGTISGSEDAAIVLNWGNFGIADVDDTIAAVTLATPPADGDVQRFDGSAWVDLTAGQTISRADVDAGLVRFMPDANESGGSAYATAGLGDQHLHYAGFQITATDSGGAATTGTVTIDVAPVVDAVGLVADPSATGSITGGNSIAPAPSVGLVREFFDDIATLASGPSSTDPTALEAGIEAATATSSNVVSNVGVAGVGDWSNNVPMAVDDAYEVSGLIYMEAGRTYTFSGFVDDSVRIEVGGETVASGRWGSYATNDHYDGAGNIVGASYVPAETGYYTLDIFLYNTSGPNGYDINVSVDGGPVQDLSTANYYLYTGIADVDAGGGQHAGFIANGATGEGGYYPAALNSGMEDSAIKLSALTPSFGDSADNSESHVVALSDIPVGAVLSDGTHSFTATAGNTSAVLWNEDNPAAAFGGSNWNLATLTVTPPANFNGSFNLTATATATEIATGQVTSATTTLPVTVVAVDDAPVVGSATASLSEEGLADGIADTTGSPDTTDAATVSGTIPVSDVDSATLAVTLVAPVAALTSGGVAITWSGSGTQTLIGSAGAAEVVRATVDDAGHYTVTLSKGIDQSGSGEGAGSFGIGIGVSDGVNTSNGTINLTIEDDSAVASNTTVSLAGTATQTNLAIVLDLSGSMADASGMAGLDRLAATVAAVREMIELYDSLGDVMVNITTFSTTASAGTWMTADQAKTFLGTLTDNGWTNYDAALAEAMSAFANPGKLSGANAQNVLYFLSDGEPTQSDGDDSILTNASGGGDNGIQGAEETIWTNFLTANDISAFAVGLGTGVTTAAMDPVAYDGMTGTNRGAIAVTDMDNLNAVLGSTVTNSISGAFAAGSGGAGGFGGDGGYMAAVTYGADTFSFNGTALTVSGSGGTAYTFNAATHLLTIASAAGSFAVDMDTGAYTYTTSTSPAVSQEAFGYTLRDADGDTASGNLTINLSGYDDAPIGRDDSVMVASGSVSSNAVTISDAWLTWNDSDAEGSALSIASTSNATSHAADQVVDAVSASSGGTGAFSYAVSDGSQTDSAAVSIATTNSSTLSGTGLDNIIVGDASNETIRGYQGNDVLVGNAGNDTLYGGTGRDLLSGGVGSDTFRWSLGDAAGSPTDTIADFNTATPASGGDVLNLRDLLVGELHLGSDPGNLANYLHFSYADGNTTINVTTHDANATTQTIVLSGVNLVGAYTTDAQIIQNLLSNNKLITD